MNVFPEQYSELEKFSEWAHATELERAARRRASTPEELNAFYDMVKPHLESMLDYLDGFSLNDMPAAEEKLLNLILMMVEVAVAVEKFDGVGVVPLAIPPKQFKTIVTYK